MSDLNATALHAALLQLGITAEIEKSEIESALNATLFVALWMGIYTVVYGGTMYGYLTRVSTRHYVVPTAMSILYLCNVAIFGLEWDSTKLQLIDNGDTRDSVFLALFSAPIPLPIALNTLTNIAIILSDGLLIWRCFHVWNCSFRVISIPGFLLLAETALFITQLIGGLILQNSTRVTTFNKISSAGLIIAACTTILTTALIAFRIGSFLKANNISSRKFKHIIDIVVQSGAIYSLSILTYGICSAIVSEGSGFPSQHIYAMSSWSSSFALPLSGISTTLMVSRVAMLTADAHPASSVHLTGLHFRPQSSTHIGTGAQITVDIPAGGDAKKASAREGEQIQAQNLQEKVNQSV